MRWLNKTQVYSNAQDHFRSLLRVNKQKNNQIKKIKHKIHFASEKKFECLVTISPQESQHLSYLSLKSPPPATLRG